MNKNFFSGILFFSVAMVGTGFQSCCNSKAVTAPSAVQTIPSSLSIAPKMFRANALIVANPLTDSLQQKIIFSMLILDVTERGSSLSFLAAAGDTIDGESSISMDSKNQIIKGDHVTALIEERLQLNSERPLMVIREIRKK